MSEPEIGTWIRRRTGKWHLVESVVAGDVVTRCGRRMEPVTASARLKSDGTSVAGLLQVSEVMPLTRMIGQPQLCKAGCDREDATVADVVAAFPPEDDASTAPVDAPDVP